MRILCIDLTDPAWWGVILSVISTVAVIVIAVVQIRIQRQQAKAQEYELYRRVFSQIFKLDFFNKTILLRMVAILTSNEDKKLRLKLIDDIWQEYEKRSDEFTECTIDIELKKCGEGLDVKYYYDAFQASREVILMFKLFVEQDFFVFNPLVAHNIQLAHTTPPEEIVNIILSLYRGINPHYLKRDLLAYTEIVEKSNQAQILEIIKERITPDNNK
jgi:hypothetical protein